jgi:hypothetical protein
VYVQPYPGPGPMVQVSADGGDEPMWSPDGKVLYYVNGREVMAVTMSTAPLAVASRRKLFEGNFVFLTGHSTYDVAPDGRHFLMLRPVRVAQAIVIHNWRAELKKSAPTTP